MSPQLRAAGPRGGERRGECVGEGVARGGRGWDSGALSFSLRSAGPPLCELGHVLSFSGQYYVQQVSRLPFLGPQALSQFK